MAVEEHKKNDEAEIKRVIEGGVEAVCARDIDGVMSIYAPKVVSFDIVPPLRYVGADAFRKVWEEVFFVCPGPIDYEIHDLNITVGDDVAFTYSLKNPEHWAEDQSLAALDRLLPEDQRQVADCASSELSAGRFGAWQSGAGPQAIAMRIGCFGNSL
jgi:ketosteroid isomerase-like protein